MLDHAKQALVAGVDLPPAGRIMLATRVASLHHLQSKALTLLAQQATPDEKQAIEQVLRVCQARCECLGKLQHKCTAPDTCKKCTPEAYRRVVMSLPDQPLPR